MFSTSTIEVGFLGFLDCANTLWAPSAKITELRAEPLGKKTYEIEDTDIVVKLPSTRDTSWISLLPPQVISFGCAGERQG